MSRRSHLTRTLAIWCLMSASGHAATQQVTFQPTQAIIPNPERGFFTQNDFWPLLNRDYSGMRAQGDTLTRPYIRLDAYRTGPIPQTFLNDLSATFGSLRQSGIKAVIRFSYNFPNCVGTGCNPAPDATVTQIQQHLQQLAPILNANEDVISSMEAGFIGAWGEWHNSTNSSDLPAAKQAVWSAILANLPASRMVAIRMPFDIRQFQVNGPLTSGEAFSGSAKARTGSHQDCFLASPDDWGTWGVAYDGTTKTWNPSGFTVQEDKDYIAANGLYAVVGGETCNYNPPRSDCPTALAELEYLRFSYLNEDFEQSIIQGFKTQGCFDEIKRRLGYRFEMLNGSYSTNVPSGGPYSFDLQLTNRGFAPMFNARPVYAVLQQGSNKYTFPLSADPRRWQPKATTSVVGSFTLPSGMPAGTYTLALWLPDISPTLQGNPLYAVQMANLGTWNATEGYNVIATDVQVTPPPNACDVNQDGVLNVSDVQISANQAIGLMGCSADINLDGRCDVLDVQRVIVAALGGQCVSP